MFNKYAAWACAIALCIGPQPICQAGVTASTTRVIFPSEAKEQSLELVNLNAYPVLVQTWIDDGNIKGTPEESDAPIFTVPPIFRMEPKERSFLRLINSGATLPNDRESLFWLNLVEVPPQDSASANKNDQLTITLRTQLKVFVRPAGLAIPANALLNELVFKIDSNANSSTLIIENPTPYFATISAIEIQWDQATQPYSTDMIEPFGRNSVPLQGISKNTNEQIQLRFFLVDDSGQSVSGHRVLSAR